MFQGSAHVPSGQHIALLQAAGAVGQRHHLVRPHQLLRDAADRRARPRAVAGGRPAGHPAGHADPGEPGQPARGGEGGEAAALRQRAVRRRDGAAERADLPGRPPVRAHHDRLDGRPERRHPGRRADLLPDPLPADNAVLSIVGDVDPEDAFARAEHLLRPPGRRGQAGQAGHRAAAAADRDGARRDLRRRCRPRRSTCPGDCRPRDTRAFDAARPGRSACSATDRRRGCTSSWSAAPSTPRRASASSMGLIGGNSFGFAYARARDGVPIEQLEDGPGRRGRPAGRRAPDRAGAAPGEGAVRAALAARAGPGGLAGRRAGRVRDAARRPEPDQLPDRRDRRGRSWTTCRRAGALVPRPTSGPP